MNGRFFSGNPGRRGSAKAVTPPPTIAVGSMIDSACAKCKRVTSHRVARKVGVQPTLLECSVCTELHAYKSPAASAQAKRRRENTRRADDAPTPEEAWARAMKRAGDVAVAYSVAGHFPVGQRLSHREFGDGVVTRRASATVCTVIFQSGEKKLLMGSPDRPAESAAKP
jgi:hypothetical protein